MNPLVIVSAASAFFWFFMALHMAVWEKKSGLGSITKLFLFCLLIALATSNVFHGVTR